MSHGDHASGSPPFFVALHAHLIASRSPHKKPGEALVRRVQFHPLEVTHTKQGNALLRFFIVDICGCATLGQAAHIIEDQIARVREQVGGDEVILVVLPAVPIPRSSPRRCIARLATSSPASSSTPGLLRAMRSDQVMAR